MSIRYHETEEVVPGRTRGHGVHRLVEYGLEWLSSSVALKAAIFYTVDADGRAFGAPLAILSDDELDPRMLANAYHARAGALDPYAPQHFAAEPDIGVVGSTDVDPAARAAYAATFLVPFGFGEQTTLLLRRDGRIAAGIVLLREPGERELEPAELDLLVHTQPVIEHAYVLACNAVPPSAAPERPGR